MKKHAIYILIIVALLVSNVMTLRGARQWKQTAVQCKQTADEWEHKYYAEIELFQKLAIACQK